LSSDEDQLHHRCWYAPYSIGHQPRIINPFNITDADIELPFC